MTCHRAAFREWAPSSRSHRSTMAEADIKLRPAGVFAGARNHTGTGAEVVVSVPLDPNAVQYIFKFVAKTSNSNPANGSKRVVYMVDVADNETLGWQAVA